MSYLKTIWGKISDTVGRGVRIDASTHSLQTLDYAHHEVHSGSHYYIQGHTVLASAGVLRIKLDSSSGLYSFSL